MGLLRTLIINAVIPPIILYIYASNSLRKYIVSMMIVILKIFYWIEKNIGSPNHFANVKGINSFSDLYSVKRKGCRKH